MQDHTIPIEPVIDPRRRIVDPHVHLWRRDFTGHYLADDLRRDLDSGHRVDRVIHVECHEAYLPDGPEELRPLGETAHVLASARQEPRIAGLVANIDLRLGPALPDIVASHMDIAGGLLRGVRHPAVRDPHRTGLDFPGHAPQGLLDDPAYVAGIRALGRLGLVCDQLVFFHQLPAIELVARKAPDTIIVLNHFGLPLLGGPYSTRAEEVRTAWRQALTKLAELPNLHLKLGGFSNCDAGFNWFERAVPPSSAEVAAAWRPWIEEAVAMFGPGRCMFESNFPVDRNAMPYRTLWNAFKTVVADWSEAEKDALFSKTATRIYGLDPDPDDFAAQQVI
jgi:L-fuconolactonase